MQLISLAQHHIPTLDYHEIQKTIVTPLPRGNILDNYSNSFVAKLNDRAWRTYCFLILL